MTSLTEEFAATDPVVDEEGASLQVNDAPIPEEVAQEEQADPSVTPDEQLNLDDPHDIEAARQAAFERGAQVIADTQGRETTARDNAIIGAAFDQAVETAGEQQAVWGMDMFMSIFQQFFGAIMGNDGSMEGLDFGNIFGGLFTPSDGHDHGSPPISGNGSYEGSGATISLEHPIKDYSGVLVTISAGLPGAGVFMKAVIMQHRIVLTFMPQQREKLLLLVAQTDTEIISIFSTLGESLPDMHIFQMGARK